MVEEKRSMRIWVLVEMRIRMTFLGVLRDLKMWVLLGFEIVMCRMRNFVAGGGVVVLRRLKKKNRLPEETPLSSERGERDSRL